jgi:hypothetical protein
VHGDVTLVGIGAVCDHFPFPSGVLFVVGCTHFYLIFGPLPSPLAMFSYFFFDWVFEIPTSSFGLGCTNSDHYAKSL